MIIQLWNSFFKAIYKTFVLVSLDFTKIQIYKKYQHYRWYCILDIKQKQFYNEKNIIKLLQFMNYIYLHLSKDTYMIHRLRIPSQPSSLICILHAKSSVRGRKQIKYKVGDIEIKPWPCKKLWNLIRLRDASP